MQVEKLDNNQLKYLESILKDWAESMHQKGKFIIPDILKKMKNGKE